MSERQEIQLDPQIQSPQGSSRDDMISWVVALETALLPCLPARELQAIDRSPHPSHQIDVERHARDFMEAAKKLQLYLLGLQREDQPTKAEMLTKEIATMEEELKTKSEIIEKQERLIQGWRKDLSDQLEKHNTELEREIATMEEELKTKSEIIENQERLIQGWRKDLSDQLDKHNTELERV